METEIPENSSATTEERELCLGDKVMDIVSEMEGVLTVKLTNIAGYIQFCVSTKEHSKDFFIDPIQLKLIEASAVPHTPIPEDVPHLIGCKVKHRVSGFTGIVIERMDCLNGCVKYAVMGKKTKQDPKGPLTYTSHQMLEILERDSIEVSPDVKENAVSAKSPGPPPELASTKLSHGI